MLALNNSCTNKLLDLDKYAIMSYHIWQQQTNEKALTYFIANIETYKKKKKSHMDLGGYEAEGGTYSNPDQ